MRDGVAPPDPLHLVGGPPGIRTPNLRIKSLVRSCRSERRGAREQPICVSVLPIVSRRFPFLHGDETGMEPPGATGALLFGYLRFCRSFQVEERQAADVDAAVRTVAHLPAPRTRGEARAAAWVAGSRVA